MKKEPRPRMPIRTFLLAALASLLGAAPAAARVIDRVVAVVNDEVITWSEVEDAISPQLRELDDMPDPVVRQQQRDRLVRRALDDLISARLVEQEAANRKLTITGEDVQDHLERVKARQGWDDEQLRMYLSSQGLTLAEFRKEVREQLLRQRVVGSVIGSRIRISDGDLQDYYKQKLTQANAEYEIEAAHIVLKVPEGGTPADDAATRQKAREILARAQAGEDFTALAREYSEGPAAEQGGYLGTFRKGSLDPALEKALAALDAGQVGGPVRTRYGYHVVKTIAKRAVPPPPFEEAKNELRRELTDKRMNEELIKWVDELKQKAFIDVRLQ